MDFKSPRFFSRWQIKVIAAGVTMLALIVLVTGIVYAGTGFGYFLNKFSGVIWPLALAGILAGMLKPFVDLLEKRVHIPRSGAIIIIFVLFFGILTVASAFLFPLLMYEITDFFRNLPGFFKEVQNYIADNVPVFSEKLGALELMKSGNSATHGLDEESLRQMQRELGDKQIAEIFTGLQNYFLSLSFDAKSILASVKGFVMNTWALLLHTILVFIYLFFFLHMMPNLANMLRDEMTYVPEKIRMDIHFVVSRFMGLILAFFRGQLVICMLSGILMSIGFAICGIKYSLILGLCFGLLNIVPCLGYIVGVIVSFLIGLLQPDGSIHTALLAVLSIGITLLLDSKAMTPVIIGRSVGLHPLVIIISLFFWSTAIDGILGFLVAIPLTAIIVVIWQVVKSHYLPSYSHSEENIHPDALPESKDS